MKGIVFLLKKMNKAALTYETNAHGTRKDLVNEKEESN